MSDVGARIKAERLARAMTQQELADAAGISRLTLSNIERGKTQPRMPTLWKIAEVLQRAVRDLLNG
jgi:transcriptional regulator with XRE-family HTH domain